MSRRKKRQVVEVEEIDAPIIISSLQEIDVIVQIRVKVNLLILHFSSRRHARQEGKLYSDVFDFYLGHLWESFPEDKRSHWNLLIFCNFDQSLESKTSAPCMLLLDSLQIADPRSFEPPIRKFVSDIFVAKERPESSKLISKIPLLVPKVPQQRDDKECGHFVLYFLSLYVENAPENFSATEGYPYFMNEGWFAHEDLDCFCEKLKSYNQ